MGALLRTSDGAVLQLAARHLIGRARHCRLIPRSPRASGEHAALRWRKGAWRVQDLGSRNGTFVGGRRLDPGERAEVVVGAILAFGDERETYTLVDAGPPRASAERDGVRVLAEEGLLALPSADDPAVMIFENARGRWVVEGAGAEREVGDGDEVEVGGATWRLQIPTELEETWDTEDAAPTLAVATLRIAHSLDEEHVEIEVVCGPRSMPLRPRAYGYLVLILARARLADAARGDLSRSEHGWVHAADLERDMRWDTERLNVEIYRCRRHLASLGIQGAAGVIERRSGSRTVRLGIGDVQVRPL